MLNLQIDSASGCWIKKRCSQDCSKHFFGQMIESDARAFQSSLKCRLFDPSWQHSIRESRTYFNVFRPIWDRKRQTEKQFEMLLPEHRQLGQCSVNGRTAHQQPFFQNVRHLSTLCHLTQRFSCWSVLLSWQYTKRFLPPHVTTNVARVLSRAASRNANHRNGHFTRR